MMFRAPQELNAIVVHGGKKVVKTIRQGSVKAAQAMKIEKTDSGARS
jgi:hypothetical protein